MFSRFCELQFFNLNGTTQMTMNSPVVATFLMQTSFFVLEFITLQTLWMFFLINLPTVAHSLSLTYSCCMS